ncbi:S-adenosyl-L-methionine-dependent methyltransferase [Phialemonium atrogriseum]|uniref:S-adenosyl-L-methionine-dependent methyltransferase n=1 Tax=Phialemonium atrogriseum TaxID=1093897 RepID=A0AAJ0BPL4_9PEZI|nr:S-adenosyl-L-methionine-dependent methyltransferase [Phialemonium atrogriseum]KAK1761860.1 S-adenosyl-L-methionine-dependent methyltransferase [Phialemonium atrogriseum]
MSLPKARPEPPQTAASPASPTAPAASAAGGEGELQPPQHWTAQPLPEDDDADSTLGDDAASSTASISSSILQYRTINGRTYHSDKGNSQYWAPNDDAQNETLDIQHHVFTLAREGKLYSAPLPDKIEKVVDIGTGTGIWAIDFGNAHPNAQVTGTDLSPVQPSWVPPNVHFQIDDFSQEWTFAEGSVDFTALLKQAYKTLKPGGWVETFDFNGYFESDNGTLTNSMALAQWGIIFRKGAEKLGSTASFTVVRDKLQRKALEASGFVNIQEEALKIPSSGWPKDPKLQEVGRYSRAAITNDVDGSVGLLAGQLGYSVDDVKVYAAHLRRELRSNKVHGYYRGSVVWAQKPSAP